MSFLVASAAEYMMAAMAENVSARADEADLPAIMRPVLETMEMLWMPSLSGNSS